MLVCTSVIMGCVFLNATSVTMTMTVGIEVMSLTAVCSHCLPIIFSLLFNPSVYLIFAPIDQQKCPATNVYTLNITNSISYL